MNMKKIAGACLAATMLFSAAPVFAAEDPSSTGNDVIEYPVEKAPEATGTLENGEKVDIVKDALDAETAKEVDTDEKVLGILADAGYKAPEGATVVVVGADYNAEINDKEVSLKDKIQLAFDMNGTEFTPGTPVYVMHKMDNGEWEVIASYVNEKGEVVVEVNGLSPIIIAKVMSNGEVVAVEYEAPAKDSTKAPVKTTSTSTTKKSPNTGF